MNNTDLARFASIAYLKYAVPFMEVASSSNEVFFRWWEDNNVKYPGIDGNEVFPIVIRAVKAIVEPSK